MPCRFPKWVFKLPWREIYEASEKWNLDPVLVGAVVQVESNANRFAERQEPNYKWTFSIREYAERLGFDYHTTEKAQGRSFGLMQIMYATALERGFEGYPGELFEVETNLEYGCKHLKLMATKAGSDPEKLYAVYNGGLGVLESLRETGQYSNKKNIDRFMRIYRKLTKLL